MIRNSPLSNLLVLGSSIALVLSLNLVATVSNTDWGYGATPIFYGSENPVTHASALDVDLDCDPDTLNLKSKGKWITCYIEFEPYAESSYKIEQVNWSEVVVPVPTPETGAEFYDYFSASSHTGYESPLKSIFMLHKDILTDDVSLVIHHNIDRDTSGIVTGSGRVDFNLEGIPPGAFVSQSDDPSHNWDPPRTEEFSLYYTGMEGHWFYGDNTDGGVLDGLPTDEEWSITIDPMYWDNIDGWKFISGDGAEHFLDMTLPVTISRVEVSHSVHDIDATTILLNGALAPELNEKYGFVTDTDSYIMDHDNDSVLERMVKFDRSEVEELLSPGEEVILTMTGELHDGTEFEGTDVIRVMG